MRARWGERRLETNSASYLISLAFELTGTSSVSLTSPLVIVSGVQSSVLLPPSALTIDQPQHKVAHGHFMLIVCNTDLMNLLIGFINFRWLLEKKTEDGQ